MCLDYQGFAVTHLANSVADTLTTDTAVLDAAKGKVLGAKSGTVIANQCTDLQLLKKLANSTDVLGKYASLQTQVGTID